MRAAKSPYRKYQKTPYKYTTTPLHKEKEGVACTPENIRLFEDRVGIREWRVLNGHTRS